MQIEISDEQADWLYAHLLIIISTSDHHAHSLGISAAIEVARDNALKEDVF